MDILTGTDSRATSSDVFHLPQDPFDFDQVSNGYRPFGHDDESADEIIDDVVLLLYKSPNSYTGEDVIEISCHGKGVYHYFPTDATIIDIGGQDSKIINLDSKGKKVSFKMNRKCAAGTGTFLQEIANRLEVPIEDLNGLALKASKNLELNSYCTVFASTEILTRIREGENVEDMVKGALNSIVIISAGIAGSIAMGISGISGAYMTEKAERTKKLKELEKAMLKDMKDSIHGKSHKFASIFAAVVDGVSPAMAAMIVISPFFISNFGIITQETAFFICITITMIVLVLLGIFLAKISDENMIKYGIQMLLVGLITALLCVGTSVLLGGNVPV